MNVRDTHSLCRYDDGQDIIDRIPFMFAYVAAIS